MTKVSHGKLIDGLYGVAGFLRANSHPVGADIVETAITALAASPPKGEIEGDIHCDHCRFGSTPRGGCHMCPSPLTVVPPCPPHQWGFAATVGEFNCMNCRKRVSHSEPEYATIMAEREAYLATLTPAPVESGRVFVDEWSGNSILLDDAPVESGVVALKRGAPELAFIAQAVFRASFSDDEDEQIVKQKWCEWEDDRTKAIRTAHFVIRALGGWGKVAAALATSKEVTEAIPFDEIDLFRVIRKAGRSNADKAKAVYSAMCAAQVGG
jgi:hypothetical protein